MRITWVTRSFLDYRIPVYAELDRLCGNRLTLIYNGEVVPERCQRKLQIVLGNRSVSLNGEKLLSGQKIAPVSSLKRSGVRIPWQPGLVQACHNSNPEVCVSDGFFQWTYVPLWMRLRHHIPHVMCYEPTKHTERNAQFYRTWYRRFVARWIDAICCNGSLCREYCRDVLHISESKLYLGNMAADSEQLAKTCKQQISAQNVEDFKHHLGLKGTIFLFVGRLVELKGLRQLLRAWKNANITDATFLCVGDGAQRSELEQYCIKNHIEAVFAGEIDYDSLPIYYRCSDVFIIPTLQDNWSLVVPEAMACGLPIACSKYNGCWPELVMPENGWIFDPFDMDNTSQTLREICSQHDNLKAMGQKSSEIVELFSPERVAETIYQACQKSLQR